VISANQQKPLSISKGTFVIINCRDHDDQERDTNQPRQKTGLKLFQNFNFRNIYAAIFLHSAAHFLQASAHSLQCSFSCLEHSAAQASQSVAQILQTSFALSLPRLISCADA
jgi:hypothetical protein